jgi:branched-chain amino acid aminotransferase
MPPTGTIVFLNGRFIPESEARLSIYDMAIVLGATVTEMTRTFNHKPFRLEDHVHRLFCSLRYTRIDIGMTPNDVIAATLKVVENNVQRLDHRDEVGVVHFITGGEFHEYVGSAGRAPNPSPTVCIHSFPIPFHYFAEKMVAGAHAVTPSIRKIPSQCVDPKIKCRSRMNFFLAEKEAQLIDPNAICLMLELDGHVTEGTGSNFLIVEKGKLVSPPRDQILWGISRQTVLELAQQMDIPVEERLLDVHDVMNADEALSTTTPYSICPVVKINGSPIGNGKPGPMFRRLADAWSKLVGVDIVRQIVDGAERTRAARAAQGAGSLSNEPALANR